MQNCSRTLLLTAVISMVFSVSYALADDVSIGSPENPIQISAPLITYQETHEEDINLPHKGFAFVYVKNTGLVPWTDFHFELIDVGYGVANVDFVPPPTSTQTLDSYAYDNAHVGATMDLYFAGDPILPNQVATFTLYTDNTVSNYPFFGLLMYPTPEPSSLLLLALGGLALIRKR